MLNETIQDKAVRLSMLEEAIQDEATRSPMLYEMCVFCFLSTYLFGQNNDSSIVKSIFWKRSVRLSTVLNCWLVGSLSSRKKRDLSRPGIEPGAFRTAVKYYTNCAIATDIVKWVDLGIIFLSIFWTWSDGPFWWFKILMNQSTTCDQNMESISHLV